MTVERRHSPDGRVLWVDAVDPTDDELTCLEEEFGLHPLAIEDVRKHAQRPKLEVYPNHAFLVARSAALQEVDVFWSDDWVVSVRERDDAGNTWPVDGVQRRFERARLHETAPGFLVYVLLDELVDGYFLAVERAEDHLEAIEDRVFAEHERPAADETGIQEHLFDVRRELLHFRRAVLPLRDVVAALIRDGPVGFDEHTRTHLQDVYDHVLRVVDLVDAQRELMGNAVEAHLAIISNRMNQVMKKMTSWGAILLGATLVARIYCINFEHMPELGWVLGYPLALALIATITVVGVWYFRHKDWL